MTTAHSQAAVQGSAVPRKVLISAWAVPVMVLGQFSFFAAIPVAIIVVAVLHHFRTRAIRWWAITLGTIYTTPMAIWALRADRAPSLSMDMSPIFPNLHDAHRDNRLWPHRQRTPQWKPQTLNDRTSWSKRPRPPPSEREPVLRTLDWRTMAIQVRRESPLKRLAGLERVPSREDRPPDVCRDGRVSLFGEGSPWLTGQGRTPNAQAYERALGRTRVIGESLECATLPDMGLLVRCAEPQDAPVVARVHVDSWRRAYSGLLPQEYLDTLSVEARTKTWAKAFSQLPGQTPTNLVAELDGQIIGIASVGPNRDNDTDTATHELWGLYLDPPHWGAGHGHTLHTGALDVAHASGAAAATLWVLTTNQRARHFYERHGWAADGAEKTAWRGDVRLDETRYRLSLRAWAPRTSALADIA